MNIDYKEHLSKAKNRFGEMMDTVFEGDKLVETTDETISFRNALYTKEDDNDDNDVDVGCKVVNDIEPKVADVPTWNTQFIVNKIFDNLLVFKSLTLTFNKNELDEVLDCLRVHSNFLENLEFSLNINDRDECEVTFKRRYE